MPKKTKAVYDVVTTYGMHRDIIFTLHNETYKNYISVVNTRTGEYHQIPYKNDGYGNFLYMHWLSRLKRAGTVCNSRGV